MEEKYGVMVCGHGSRDEDAVSEFLNFAKESGNDLITPAPQYGFPGLKSGDQWCVCAGTWLAAVNAGVPCPVDLEATHHKTLEIIPLEILEAHSM